MNSLQDKIRLAQTAHTISAENAQLPFESMAEALAHHYHQRPSSVYLIAYNDTHERTELTYSEFGRLVALTMQFYRRHNLNKGDRIATASHNHYETIVQYFAAWCMGLCVVPLNMSEDDNRLTYIVNNANLALIISRPEYFQRISLLNFEHPIEHCSSEDISSEYLLYPSQKFLIPENPPEIVDEALIVYTSGTTGNPKGVVLTQRNMIADAIGIAQWHEIDETQRMMCVLPIHHVNGAIVTHVTPLVAGCSVVLLHKFQTDTFFRRIVDEQVTIASVVPTLLAFLVQANANDFNCKQFGFRHIICGAGPLTCDLARQFVERYAIPIIHGYGLSESTCYSSFLETTLNSTTHKEYLFTYGYPSIGTPIPQNEMAIHDEHGNALGQNQRGEIVIRGWNIMKGYYNNLDANQSAFTHGWFRTGDEGFYIVNDAQKQYFFITGRLKELIIRGGVNIAPLEIDEVLNSAPGVRAAICVGFPHDMYGEEIGALAILDENATAEGVLKYCKDYLPFSKTPKVLVLTNELPITTTGKYQRNKVKHLFAQWQSTQFSKE